LDLTESGRNLAEKVVRKHRLAERLLVDVIGLEWHKVHREAGRWEHVISDDVEARLVELLGDPATCPHGNPIPGSHSAAPSAPTRRLGDVDQGERVRLMRISEEVELNLGSLTLLDQGGFIPGVVAVVGLRHHSGDVDVDEGGEVRLKSASGNLSVGAAQALHARSASGDLLVGRLVDRSSMQTTSGNLRVGGAATEVRMETVSGSLAVDVAERGLSARSVSGDVRVSCVANGEVVVQTVSGDVEVGVAPRRSVEVDAQSLSGHLSSEIDLDGGPGVVGGEPAGRVRVKFNSVSGDLRLVRAAEPEPARSAWAAVSPDDDQAPAAAPAPAPVPAGAEPPNAAETEPPAEVAAELPPSELPPAEAAGA